MKYNQLTTNKTKSSKRVGRGIASGQGKTAGRGTKGQMSRTGSTRRPGFEGGQNPLMQRLPKLHGFRSLQTKAEVVYLSQLDALAGKPINSQTLAAAQLISSPFVSVKLLSKGEVSKKLTVQLQSASASAVAAIDKVGGSFERVERVRRPVNSDKLAKKNESAAQPKAALLKKK
jgi:large subunit ribosomal protein L15